MFAFVVLITVLAYVFGQALGYGSSFVGLALVLSGLMSLGSYYFSDQAVLAISGAKRITENDDPELFHVAENLSMAAGLPTPEIYMIPDASPNAFATGRDPKHAVLGITAGLRTKLDKAELEGVVAHELSHIENYDTRLEAVVTVLVGIVVIMADYFSRSLWWGGRNRDEREGNQGIFVVIGLVLALFSPLFAILIQLAISRQREFLADASGAYLTRYPEGLIRALEKISADPRPAGFANNATAHLFIVNPFKGKEASVWFSGLFDTHPSIEERIKRLREM